MLPLAGLLDGAQSALAPRGPAADEIASLSWLLFGTGTAILVVVLALTACALFARRSRRAWMTRGGFIIVAGGVVPFVLLAALLVHVLLPGGHGHGGATAALRIEVTGEQWWWRVRYLDASGRHDFATANEIRIPVGTAVDLTLRSADVIHSFWVPSLAPKLDMIPGRVNRLVIAAGQAGEFRGQCAEYCGAPHARMALFVIATSTDDFEAWTTRQRQAATSPQTAEARRGERAFAEHGCGTCHAIRGTGHVGTRGPDLTHVADRVSLGAGTLRAAPGAMAAWIVGSQHVKPGNLMPDFAMLPADELGAIAAYLQALQ